MKLRIAFFALLSLTSLAAEHPNIVLMMADDQGWGDVAYNGHPFVQTPNLDAMAKASHVFDRFYAAGPVCSPTRASVFTARTPNRSGVASYGVYLRPKEQTLARVLKEAGYVTGLMGKFHIGSALPDNPCNPGAMGFDEWVIGLNYFDNDPLLSRNGVVEKREGKGTRIVMDEALAFLEKHRGAGKPMFAVVWFPAPHHPHAEAPDGPVLYEGKPQAGLFREVTLLDEQVGRLRAGLRKMGIEKDTIVWYCSDNGGLLKESSGGRESKGSIYEGGLRVPAMIEWPARALKGHSQVPVSTYDIFPSVLAMAGVDWKALHPIDGEDVSGIISGEAKARRQPLGFWQMNAKGEVCNSDKILGGIMEQQKAGQKPVEEPQIAASSVYATHEEGMAKGHAAWNEWPWKLHRIHGETYELYNLAQDPMEATDLAGSSEHQERLARMKKALDAWMRSVVQSMNGKDYN